MKENRFFANIALSVVLGIALAVCAIVRAFLPMGVLPKLDIPNMVLLSLAALLLDHYWSKTSRKFCPCMPLLAAASFGLLPWAAGFASSGEAGILAIVGGVTFGVSAWLFSEVQDRLSSGPAAKLAPLLSALGLYLAAQCFSGLLL